MTRSFKILWRAGTAGVLATVTAALAVEAASIAVFHTAVPPPALYLFLDAVFIVTFAIFGPVYFNAPPFEKSE